MGSIRNRRVDPSVDGTLGRLLAAAAAPAGRHELAGEDTAAAMWRAAYRRPVPVAPRRRWRTRIAAVKIATVGVVLGLGGVALAQSAGVFTGPPGKGRPSGGHSQLDPTGGSGIATISASGSPGRPGQSPAASGPGTRPTATESVVVAGLCDAYVAAMTAGRDNVLDAPAFAPLIAAAGGREQVAPFCAALVAPTPTPDRAHPTPAPHPSPTPPAHPGGGNGNGTPAGRPTELLTTTPTTHPSR